MSTEFYDGDELVATIHEALVHPRPGELVATKYHVYRVEKVQWAIDYIEGPHPTAVRCLVEMKRRTK